MGESHQGSSQNTESCSSGTSAAPELAWLQRRGIPHPPRILVELADNFQRRAFKLDQRIKGGNHTLAQSFFVNSAKLKRCLCTKSEIAADQPPIESTNR